MPRPDTLPENVYGFVGWREFLRTTQDLLNRFDSAKGHAASRPVKAEHGPVAEALVREWLEGFLPSKYGVSSGYVIPGLIVDDYKLLHYDVIIYDRFSSPILWIDNNPDLSEKGRQRAIPAE